MTNVDQFESVFRAADKPVFRHRDVKIPRVLVVTDLPADEAGAFAERVRSFLSVLPSEVEWTHLSADDFHTSSELLERVEKAGPGLVAAYRNLRSDGWRWPHSLGEHLDLLTQIAPAPVLVCPHPQAEYAREGAMRDTRAVMAVTDHLAGDDTLVNWAAAFTATNGTLYLGHVEDEATFQRYIDVISKIPSIDTDVARVAIGDQLLKQARDYIESVRGVLRRDGAAIEIRDIVTLGHHLGDYRRLIDEHDVSLLVMNTRDEDQLAMHGLAYPLAVELRQIPLLML